MATGKGCLCFKRGLRTAFLFNYSNANNHGAEKEINFARLRYLTRILRQSIITIMYDDFSLNLSFLCSHHPSIAEVCRRLDFNRQQFNKYLNGQSRPSRANMRRICDFFGVTEFEILFEPSQFRNLVAVRYRPIAQEMFSAPLEHLNNLYGKSQNMDRYCGYYFRYFYSFSNAGKITKSLCVIYESEGKYFWKNIELVRDSPGSKARMLSKYEGVVFFLTNRLYVIEYETLQMNSLTQMTLYPSYHTQIGHLNGIQTGSPTRRGRQPSASKVLLEFLGHSINVKKALYSLGSFFPHEDCIPNNVVDQITNLIPEGSYVLEVGEP